MREKYESSQRLPQWVQEALAGMPEPDSGRLAKFDHLKGPVVKAFRQAYATESLVDAVFTLAGRLVEVAHGIRIGLQETLGPSTYATAGVAVRGAEGPSRPKGRILAVVKKAVDGCMAEAVTYEELEGTRLEINLIEAASARPVRPFDVVVKDEQGRPLAKPVHVPEGKTAASFPGPASGLYLFDLTWAGGTGTMTIRFQ
jgi:hypothetical protein